MPVTPPIISDIRTLHLPVYETIPLSNGMQLHILKGGAEPVMKAEFVFKAGATYENTMTAAEVTAAMMSEGTQRLNSVSLAETFESVGATLQTRGGVDTMRVRLYTLTRFLQPLLEPLYEVIREPAFDERELGVYKANKVERLQIDLKKNEVLAYRHLTEALYGPAHPYGRNALPEHYMHITRDDLVHHHQHTIQPDRGMLFLSGSFTDKDVLDITSLFQTWTGVQNGVQTTTPLVGVQQKGRIDMDGPQSHQAAIRIGRKLFTQHHPDYDGVFILNTILGGYFGSRLMNELRENQGLTYGIYSGVDTFAQDGCFYISTETTTANIDTAIDAIRLEAEKLQQELVGEEELKMVRNYLMGHFMTLLDGPFATMDFIKNLKIESLDNQVFERLITTIQQITPEQIRDLARHYLNLEEWVTVVIR